MDRGLLRPTPPFYLTPMTDPALDRQIQAIERPDKVLLKYYLISCLVFPPLLLIAGPYYYFRYHTMRYRFTDDGISMSWGILFRREIIVNYARIQDIHLKSNLVERWLGLARILVQTASGSSAAEMTIEGIKEFEPLRDFLYARMRGVKESHPDPAAANNGASGSDSDEVAAALREAVAELRALREELAARKP